MNFCKRSILFSGIYLSLLTSSTYAQIDPNDVKFDYKNLTVGYDAMYRKLEKPEKLFTNINNSFAYNYPAEIDMLRGGYLYRGKVHCRFASSQSDADSFTVISDFKGLKALNFKDDESVPYTPAGTYNSVTGYIRNYNVVYPVTMHFYKKGVLMKTVDFFTESAPLVFRLTKEQIDPKIQLMNTPFVSKQELADLEKAGRMNKAAERYAYFEAIRKVDELIKTYFGTFDYEFEIGSFSVRKKKAGAYADLNAAAEVLDNAIGALKKKNMPAKDSLARVALQQFQQLSALNDPRINAVVKSMLNYNMLVCYALLGEMDKASELLTAHRASDIQKVESFSAGCINRYLDVHAVREKFRSGEVVHL
jgi:hypothetical protein